MKLLEINVDGKNFFVSSEEFISELKKSFIGNFKLGTLFLDLIEVIYLCEIRNAIVREKTKILNIENLFEKFYSKNLLRKYYVYRDWKNRGLFLTFLERIKKENYGKSPIKKYPSFEFKIPEEYKKIKFYFLEDEISSISFDPKAKELFENFWFGQYGIYKNYEKGKFLFLDYIETLYLAKNGFKFFDFSNRQLSYEDLEKAIKKKFEIADYLLEVYEDWRNNGYVVKTGYKFGTHFRLYFPGASPTKKGKEWQHSKHAIHVFPQEVKMPMNQWARAIRVAHSVRKTFITAIPKARKEEIETQIDYVAYHRKENNEVEKPNIDKPSFLITSLWEDEELSGSYLANALKIADELGLRLLIAIVDKESSITYYVANKIELPNSKCTYYEIEWINP